MTATILVTGSTGTIGSRVLATLAETTDVEVRAGVRPGGKRAQLRFKHIVPLDFDFEKPGVITVGQAAQMISEVSGRSIHYVDVPEESARKAMLDAAIPKNMVDEMMELHAIDKAGHAATVTTTVKDVTGRAPMTFKKFARKNASHWKRG